MDTSYRVYRVPSFLKDAISTYRKEQSVTWEFLIQYAVEQELDGLCEQIMGLGLVSAEGKTARLPMAGSVLEKLSAKSAESNTPQTVLLLSSLARLVLGGQRPPAAKKATRKPSQKAGRAKKRPTTGKTRQSKTR